MMRQVQLLRLTKDSGGVLWINPYQIAYAEVGEKKDNKGKLTILHMATKEKLFIKETPEELNKIIRSIKSEIKIEY